MSVIGFDIGNENCVIAAVKQRGVDVLLNEESKRETPAVVSFGEKQRLLGSTGAASATMNPRSTISQVKRLIGRKFKQHDVQDDLKVFPFETSEAPDGGILIHLQYLGERATFTPVQILGMLFAHLKKVAEQNLETQICDCVIGIPSYFTDVQRRLYLDAAAIGGLRPLRLLHDGTATALGYGIYKTEFTNSSISYVVFVDIGHSDTQVTVASFEPAHMTVLAHAFDCNLGGRDFDEVLFRHFAAQFKEQYHIDVYSNVRASIRLRAACEKLKKILSANAEAPLNIECLMDEKDVKGFIKREDFENMASNLLERVMIPCKTAMKKAGVPVEKIQSVELVGSGSRIPAITKILTSFFRREPSRKLNASECVARGCALQCAMLSPTFRVREYEVQDSLPFSIGISSDEGPIRSPNNAVLFPKGHPIPSSKIITLSRSSMFHLEAFYTDHNQLPPGVSPKISLFTIGPFQVTNGEKAKVKVKLQLSLHGIVNLQSASLMEEFTGSNAKVPAESMDVESSDLGNGPDDIDSAQLRPEAAASLNGTSRDKASKRNSLPVSETVYGAMTKAELLEALEKEFQLTQQDIKVEQAKDKKNTLESFVYDARNKILSTYSNFCTEVEKEWISQNLQQTEDWLYEDGYDETENVYAEKLEDLKKLVDPIENRYKDEEARAKATRDLLHGIVEYRMAADSLSENEKDMVLAECNKAEQWLRDCTQQQDSLPKNVDPILWSCDIRKKVEDLGVMCKHLKSKHVSPRNSENCGNADQRDVDDDMQVD